MVYVRKRKKKQNKKTAKEKNKLQIIKYRIKKGVLKPLLEIMTQTIEKNTAV